MSKLSEFFKKDFKIVENKKKIYVVPVILLIVAIIFMSVFTIAAKDASQALNLGMDFAGGYKMTVQLGDKLSGSESSIEKQVDKIFTDNGVKNKKISTQSEGSKKSLVVSYKVPVGKSEADMEEINEAIKDDLTDKLLNIFPLSVSVGGQTVTVVYDDLAVAGYRTLIENKLGENGYTVESSTENTSDDGKVTFTFTLGGTINEAEITPVFTIDDQYSGNIIASGRVSATMSQSLLSSAIWAVVIALVVMLVYIFIRFRSLGFGAALATVIALMHDILMMFAFMAIFRVEISSSFIAGLITILGYSVNNTIVIFDRVRENNKLYMGKLSPVTIANRSVKETFWRSVNTTFTTLAAIVCLAIFCVPDVQIFALPIIIGLIAGAYSSMFIAPSIWASLQERKLNKVKKNFKSKTRA